VGIVPPPTVSKVGGREGEYTGVRAVSPRGGGGGGGGGESKKSRGKRKMYLRNKRGRSTRRKRLQGEGLKKTQSLKNATKNDIPKKKKKKKKRESGKNPTTQ